MPCCVERIVRPPRPGYWISWSESRLHYSLTQIQRHGSVLLWFGVIHLTNNQMWKRERESFLFSKMRGKSSIMKMLWFSLWYFLKWYARTYRWAGLCLIMIKYQTRVRSGSLATCFFIFLSTLPSDINTIPLEAAFQGKLYLVTPGSVEHRYRSFALQIGTSVMTESMQWPQ